MNLGANNKGNVCFELPNNSIFLFNQKRKILLTSIDSFIIGGNNGIIVKPQVVTDTIPIEAWDIPTCDECDPENLFGNNNNKNDAWYIQVAGFYNGGLSGSGKAWKDMNCDDLRAQKKIYDGKWKSLTRSCGFSGTYKDYHPGDDDQYRKDLQEKVDPKISGPIDELNNNPSPRSTIASLQMLDCLMKDCP
jgi:hypothetical protein